MSHSEMLSSFNIFEHLLDKDKVAAVHKAAEVGKVHLHCRVVEDIPFLVAEDLVADKAVVEDMAYLQADLVVDKVLVGIVGGIAPQEVGSTLQAGVGIRLEVAAELLWSALGVYPCNMSSTGTDKQCTRHIQLNHRNLNTFCN
jgi:hypothetical protein